ncbi:asparagine-linked glycosylation protein [Tilletia horrida]|uniref:Asparagine-linked glycosylation protein n=1 Tax=Tilletia horrida TaxID=155126 RepID=A0AAN6JTZ1_9BASI|nr:asparagine-linked glycosylation protein [Tilletia horrida]KAK0569455.1 asparagine-linked glycosylation protein [Tilletia horrida]
MSFLFKSSPPPPPPPPKIVQGTPLGALLNTRTLVSLGFVGGLVLGAYVLKAVFLPAHLSRSAKYRRIFLWLAFDGLCHLILEGSFLYLSTFGRTVNASRSFMAYMWQDYSRADVRWGISDPTVVALEILTVLGAGPLALYTAYLLAKEDGRYHYWAIVLSTAELYGGFMTFAPEWLTGNKGLNGSNWVLLYVYLWFMNMIWVVIPVYLMVDSYGYLARALKSAPASDGSVVASSASKKKASKSQ